MPETHALLRIRVVDVDHVALPDDQSHVAVRGSGEALASSLYPGAPHDDIAAKSAEVSASWRERVIVKTYPGRPQHRPDLSLVSVTLPDGSSEIVPEDEVEAVIALSYARSIGALDVSEGYQSSTRRAQAHRDRWLAAVRVEAAEGWRGEFLAADQDKEMFLVGGDFADKDRATLVALDSLAADGWHVLHVAEDRRPAGESGVDEVWQTRYLLARSSN